jgi:glycosyltransferase involved in cell wall biosynthesis
MEKPLISFIIPFYDLPIEMLSACIESILALSLRSSEREIIVVDDGSHTSPIGSLEKYRDNIIYIRQRNKGLSEARNTGIQMAQGDYLQFVDSDDLLLQAPYEHCIDLVRFNHADMVVFDFTTTQTKDHLYNDSPLQSGSSYMRHNNIRGTACGYLFRKSILGNLRFTPGICNEDEEFTPLLMLRAEQLCVTDAEAYYYRQRPHSIMTETNIRWRLKRLNDMKAVINRLNNLTDHLPVEEKTALQRRVAQLTMDYLYNVIRQTRSRHYLDRKIEELRKEGLFPLPDQDYTAKYTMFRRITNSPRGLSLLMRIIPLLQKER